MISPNLRITVTDRDITNSSCCTAFSFCMFAPAKVYLRKPHSSLSLLQIVSLNTRPSAACIALLALFSSTWHFELHSAPAAVYERTRCDNACCGFLLQQTLQQCVKKCNSAQAVKKDRTMAAVTNVGHNTLYVSTKRKKKPSPPHNTQFQHGTQQTTSWQPRPAEKQTTLSPARRKFLMKGFPDLLKTLNVQW